MPTRRRSGAECAVGGEAFAFTLELEVATLLLGANANIDAEDTIGTP